jgi:hypothetical protein
MIGRTSRYDFVFLETSSTCYMERSDRERNNQRRRMILQAFIDVIINHIKKRSKRIDDERKT